MTAHVTTQSAGEVALADVDSPSPPADRIQSVARAIRILEVVGQAPTGVTLKGIARRTGLSKATTYHLVRTLTFDGCLLRWDPGFYTLGPAILHRAYDLSTQLSFLTQDTPPEKLAQLLRLPPHQVAEVVAMAAAPGPRDGRLGIRPLSGGTAPASSRPDPGIAGPEGE